MHYAEYLALDEILACQRPQSASDDEVLFIVTHQVQELWFSLVLRELARAREALRGGRIDVVERSLGRSASLLQRCVESLRSLDSLSADQFMCFRGALGTASGAQSTQFREIEIECGRRRDLDLAEHPVATWEALEHRLSQPPIWDEFIFLLRRWHRDGRADSSAPSWADEHDVPKLLRRACEEDRGLRAICEVFGRIEDALAEWRYRHVCLVERIIGELPGTSGSDGASALRATLTLRCFPELTKVRSLW